MVERIARDMVTEIPKLPLWTIGVLIFLVIATVITDLVFATATNVIVFFMVTIILPIFIILASVVPIDQWLDVLGFDVGKHKWMYIVYVAMGAGVGFGVYFLFAKPLAVTLGLLPLPLGYLFYTAVVLDMALMPELSMLAGAIYFIMVAFSEEIMRKFAGDVFANRFAGPMKTRDKLTLLVVGLLVGSIIWSLSHFGSYTVAQSLPIQSYVMAYMLGMIFIMPGMLGFMLKGTKLEFLEYSTIPAVVAHFIYDYLLFTHYTISFIAPTSALALII